MKSKKSKSAMWGRACLTSCLIILIASTKLAGLEKRSIGTDFSVPSKISSDLLGKNESDQVDVIVQYKDVPTAQVHEKVFGKGGVLKTGLGSFKGGAYRVPVSSLSDLAADPNVVYITPDRPLRGATTTLSLDYHNETINSSAAWSQNLTGAGIGVAVIDSGIRAAVPDLSNTVVYSQDFTGNGSAADQYGHGTHVAGIIAGNGTRSSIWNADYTFLGVAQGADLINLRVLDQNGAGTDSEVIAAIQQAIALKSTYNIRVINLSLGRPVFESYKLDPLCQAVEQAWSAGIVVVVAAGNDGRDNTFGTYGYGTIAAPGNDPYVITVGAMNTLNSSNRAIDVPASYSSKGPTLIDHVIKPDLVAPGNLIISLYFSSETLNQESPSNEVPKNLFLWTQNSGSSGYYFALSGTSMATPMVSAAAAIELQQNPNLTPDQVKAQLMQSAFKNLVQYSTATDPTTGITYNEQADIFTVGAGLLDIQNALNDNNLAPATVGSAMSPTAGINSNGNVVLQVNGSSILGGNSVLWGKSVLWGTSVFSGTDVNGNSVLWGTSQSGGASTLASDSVLWGTSILWGTSASNGDSSYVIINGDNN